MPRGRLFEIQSLMSILTPVKVLEHDFKSHAWISTALTLATFVALGRTRIAELVAVVGHFQSVLRTSFGVRSSSSTDREPLSRALDIGHPTLKIEIWAWSFCKFA